MLGMYDMPATRDANDRFWTLIRKALGYGPTHLTRDREVWEIWLDPELVFAQTCGMPYRARLHGKVQLVGTPDYNLPGCPPGHYCSVFVARDDDAQDLPDLANGVFAYNEALSQSGWAAPITHMAALDLQPKTLLESGGHALSAQAVAESRADFAALDALTWVMLKENTDLGTTLREVDTTTPAPTLPFITSNEQDAERIAQAVHDAINGLSDEDRATLHIHGLIQIPSEQYLAVPTPPPPSAFVPTT